MKLFEEFKLYENLFADVAVSKEHPWMRDVPLVYPELNMGSDPNDPEDEILIKNFTYLEGPEDVAEVLGDLITEEDVTGTDYDLQAVKADVDVLYTFLDTNFDKLVTKYDEELLKAFEDRAIEAAIREAEDEYYNGNSEYIHESSEDNMARMRRQIRDEIVQLEAEKATDTDPTSAYYYDEKIKACKAELAQLASLAPSKATLKRRAIKAEQKEKIKEIERRLRYAFKYLSKYFGHPPHCEVLKDGNWLITFKRSLTPVATAEAIDICSKAGLQIKHSAEHSNNCSAFKLDINSSNLDNYYSAWMNNIDYDAIEARLEAEQNTSVNNKIKINDLKENTTVDKVKRFKKLLIQLLIERKGPGMANRINSYNIEIDDTIPAGTCNVNGNTIYIHSSLLSSKFEDAAAKVIAAVANASAPVGNSRSSTPRYVISMKHNPTVTEQAFYNFDEATFDFDLVDRAAATVYTSLGSARRAANDILSMSDYHRINILDANTLTEVDSLDYYNDYEDTNDYPGYFDEGYDTKDLKESIKHIGTTSKIKLSEEFKLYETMWN